MNMVMAAIVMLAVISSLLFLGVQLLERAILRQRGVGAVSASR